MYLTVGEISKALGMSSEMIRFYMREGLIKPRQNRENNYWEYSSDDVMLLSDILFYRNLDLSLSDIKRIFGGLELEKIGEIIEEKKMDAIRNIEKYTKILEKNQFWGEWYYEELELLNEFRIGRMPPEIRKDGFYAESDHIAHYIKNGLNIGKDDWMIASFSFCCNIGGEDLNFRRYLSLSKTAANAARNTDNDVIEESAERCIYTEVHYSDDVHEMIDPLVAYAEENGYRLSGEIYGRENTNYYVDGKRMALYRIYAPIVAQVRSAGTEE